jgi:D-alanyl-D-alanine carboxypeptidase (penicillin-binding protein 5/6)
MARRETARDRPARRALCLAGAGVAAALFLVYLAVATGPPPEVARAETAPAPSVEARSGILIDRRTGKVLWSKRPDLRLAPASCTKIMTALLVLERYRDLDRMVRAPASVADQGGVAIGLRVGDRISVRQALYALMVKSANEAALTLASAVDGGERAFVTRMNRRAAALGLTHTHFVNCRGRPEPGHFASARDLARLGRYAMRDTRFREIVATQTAVIRWPPAHAVTVTSHNRLLDYAWGDGIKTGSTRESKAVLVGSGKPGLVPLIVVTMREPTRGQEVRDAVALFTWGSALYEVRRLVAAGEAVDQLDVSGGEPVAAVAAAGLSAVVRKAATVTTILRLPPEPLPIRPADGEKLGTVTYRSDGLLLGRADLVAAPIPPVSPSP